jgi:hypothetical protein
MFFKNDNQIVLEGNSVRMRTDEELNQLWLHLTTEKKSIFFNKAYQMLRKEAEAAN